MLELRTIEQVVQAAVTAIAVEFLRICTYRPFFKTTFYNLLEWMLILVNHFQELIC
jgi:hypothetical protein